VRNLLQSLLSPNHSSSESKLIQATRFRELTLSLMAPLSPVVETKRGFNIMILPVTSHPSSACYLNVRRSNTRVKLARYSPFESKTFAPLPPTPALSSRLSGPIRRSKVRSSPAKNGTRGKRSCLLQCFSFARKAYATPESHLPSGDKWAPSRRCLSADSILNLLQCMEY
jgi:hypothetical protein